uniref:Uncharacterized protein n=1 Tax=Amphimedon queenslandica TaxID=400682 RepID=A0A1X7SVH2_AMPQE
MATSMTDKPAVDTINASKGTEANCRGTRTFDKKPPDSLFGHEPSLQLPEPVNTLDATDHSSSSTKRVTEPLGEDVSIDQQKNKQDVSKSLETYKSQDLTHRPDCNCTGHGCFQRGLSIPDNSTLYKDPVISNQEVFPGESMGFDVPSSKTTLRATSEPGSRESSNPMLCVDTETSELSRVALRGPGDSVMSSGVAVYQYQTPALATEPSIDPKNIPDTSNSHHASQYQNN